ncbi:MAG TPA: ABC transporter permease [Thermoanaerobaculia bacterium]|nr:ABC transporter permease [Thermoanaerobaculia bacterium]
MTSTASTAPTASTDPSNAPPGRAEPPAAGWRVDPLFLLRELVKRDIQTRYAGSYLGLVWTVLQPLWQLLLFTFVFAVVLRIALPPEARTSSFALYLFAAFVPWIAVQEGILRGTSAITDGAELVKKMRLPPHLLVVTPVLGGLLQSVIAMGILALVAASAGEADLRRAWLVLLVLPFQLALTLGAALTLAAVHVFLRDTLQLVHVALMTWFYLTPVVYPFSLVPADRGGLRALVGANPLTAVVETYRAAFLGEALAWTTLVPLFVAAPCLLLVGSWIFRTLRPAFADEI